MSLASRRAAARARLSRSRGGRALLGGLGRAGHIAIPVVVGAAGQMASQMAGEKISALNKWWGQPAVLGVGAFLMIRRKPNIAHALAGAAGYAAAFNYKLNKSQTQGGPSPVPVFGSSGGSPPPALAPGAAVPRTAGDYENVGDYSPVGF